jgi:hypothetical protein
VRAEAKAGHDSIQHGLRPRRLIPGDGPRLHRRMQWLFLTRDDDRGRPRREPGRVTERSEL